MRMSFKTGLSAQQLVEFASRLDHYRASGAALTNTFKTENQLNARFIDDVAQGRFSSTNAPILPAGMPTPMLNVTKTRRLIADSARIAIKSIPLNYAEAPLRDSPLFLTNSSLRTHVGSFLRGNAIGEGLYDLLRISPRDLLTRKCEENVAVSATRTILALRAYLSQHGELPRSLSDLVPDELSTLPLDDFDGKALRYSRERRILYSVGWNTVDDGGVERNANNERLDIVFKLEF